MRLISNINLLKEFPFWRGLDFPNGCEYEEFPLNLNHSKERTILVLDLRLICGTENYVSYRDLISSFIKSSKNTVTLVVFCSEILNLGHSLTKFTRLKEDELDMLSLINSLLRDRYFLEFINLSDFFDWNQKDHTSLKNWYESRCSLSLEGLKLLTDSLKRYFRLKSEPVKKVIVLDCDNTLWGGVIGEDGLTGIHLSNSGLGEVFRDLQRFFLECKTRGFLLCLASKNNPEDVLKVFREHGDMLLSLDDIVDYRINWNSKSQNLKEISDNLSLGLDSFIFIDDNPIERMEVATAYPEVTTPELPVLQHQWLGYLKRQEYFWTNESIAGHAVDKTKQYKDRAEFLSASNASIDRSKFLKSINLCPDLMLLDDSNLQRASELTRKTNQFNLNKVPLEISEIKSLNEDSGNHIYLCSLKDRFGDHGIIGLIKYQKTNEKVIVDTFLLSCRILGRHFEQWILNEILRKTNANCIQLIYTQTPKNEMLKGVFKDLGFTLSETDGNESIFEVNTSTLFKNLKYLNCYEK